MQCNFLCFVFDKTVLDRPTRFNTTPLFRCAIDLSRPFGNVAGAAYVPHRCRAGDGQSNGIAIFLTVSVRNCQKFNGARHPSIWKSYFSPVFIERKIYSWRKIIRTTPAHRPAEWELHSPNDIRNSYRKWYVINIETFGRTSRSAIDCTIYECVCVC